MREYNHKPEDSEGKTKTDPSDPCYSQNRHKSTNVWVPLLQSLAMQYHVSTGYQSNPYRQQSSEGICSISVVGALPGYFVIFPFDSLQKMVLFRSPKCNKSPRWTNNLLLWGRCLIEFEWFQVEPGDVTKWKKNDLEILCCTDLSGMKAKHNVMDGAHDIFVDCFGIHEYALSKIYNFEHSVRTRSIEYDVVVLQIAVNYI